ncbi:MAG: tRNA dihydrouridine synthase DusB [Candidatus Marinimicrobia bacterium]|nr:tRNA dihydrouridine synthase DusB [Candidatus Neomarinimicrobiota bacterium]
MQIGDLRIQPPILLAPMAGITDHPFRVICRRYGVGVVYTEFVSANGVIREGPKSLDLVHFAPEERPIGIQIFGETAPVIAESAALLAERFQPDIIDLNFGCPVPKVTKKGAGSAMLRDLSLMSEVIKATVAAVPDLPVTVKMRAGWDSTCVIAVEAAAIVQEAGAKALALHPRTTRQGFTGQADWSLIEAVKREVSIPVIGNGDIRSPADAIRMFHETGCDAVMVARGALGQPWIFRQINALLAGQESPPVTLRDIADVCRDHLALIGQDKNERIAVNLSKKHLNWYIKGFPGAVGWRKKFMACESTDQIDQVLSRFTEFASVRQDA